VEALSLLFIAHISAEYLRSSLKLTEDPCQDFYAFACGSFRTINLMLNGPKSWDPFEIADNATTYAIKCAYNTILPDSFSPF
jgi:hypothetical protein